MNSSDESWRSILSFLLERQQPEVSGRTSIPDDLKSELQQLARGEFDETDIRKVCEKIVHSPEAIQALARLLQDTRTAPAEGENR